MIRRVASCLAGSALVIAVAAAAPDALEIYFIDTEGGQATLLVAPSEATMLIDAGFMGLDTPNPDKETGRDPARIAAVAQAAGVKAIDTLLMTHFHGDHVGGAARLAELLPIRTFIDHGPAVQPVPQLKQSVGAYSEYWAAAFAKGRHLTVSAGDRIDIPGLEVTVVQASAMATPRAGSPNPHCNGLERRMDDNPENTASIGVVIAYGQFRFANFGDLPWNEELELLCPSNRVGTIDVYEAARHGGEPSAAVYAMAPRVVVYGNGARKGGGAAPLTAFRASPGLEDIWQRHKNVPGGADGNPADDFSANLQDVDDTAHVAHYLKLTAKSDGSFRMFNSRTGTTKSYGPRRAR